MTSQTAWIDTMYSDGRGDGTSYMYYISSQTEYMT
jgi:hypothetical protein